MDYICFLLFGKLCFLRLVSSHHFLPVLDLPMWYWCLTVFSQQIWFQCLNVLADVPSLHQAGFVNCLKTIIYDGGHLYEIIPIVNRVTKRKEIIVLECFFYIFPHTFAHVLIFTVTLLNVIWANKFVVICRWNNLLPHRHIAANRWSKYFISFLLLIQQRQLCTPFTVFFLFKFHDKPKHFILWKNACRSCGSMHNLHTPL